MRLNDLDVVVTPDDPTTGTGAVTVRVAGDVDAVSAPLLVSTLRDAARGGRRLHVDVSAVTFFSTAGVDALLASQHRTTGRVKVTGAGRPIRRLLHILDLEPLFDLQPLIELPPHPAAWERPGLWEY